MQMLKVYIWSEASASALHKQDNFLSRRYASLDPSCLCHAAGMILTLNVLRSDLLIPAP
jgi:hypothetical protein